MTFPEDLAVQARPVRASNYTAGLLLNLLLPGAGFTLLGRWGWHLGWAALHLLAFFAALTLAAVTETPALMLAFLLATAVMLVHYHRSYGQRAAQGFRPTLSQAAQVALSLGHLFIGFTVTGILAAVLIPNLLAARTRAAQATESQIARSIERDAYARQTDGTLKAGSCVLDALPTETRAAVRACTVSVGEDQTPEIAVTFASGETINLP